METNPVLNEFHLLYKTHSRDNPTEPRLGAVIKSIDGDGYNVFVFTFDSDVEYIFPLSSSREPLEPTDNVWCYLEGDEEGPYFRLEKTDTDFIDNRQAQVRRLAERLGDHRIG